MEEQETQLLGMVEQYQQAVLSFVLQALSSSWVYSFKRCILDTSFALLPNRDYVGFLAQLD